MNVTPGLILSFAVKKITMISKDQLARFVRYLNQNYLSSNKIRYFSTKRKKQILKELTEIYSIEAVGQIVHFIGRNKSMFDTKYMIDTKRWFIGGKWISLPRSKPNIPSIEFRKGPFLLKFPPHQVNDVFSPRVDDEEASSPL